MSADPYSARVRDLFAAPGHAGRLAGASVVRVDGQGISIELSAVLRGACLEKLAFRARGCPHVIAAAETFCASYEGRDAAAVDAFRAADLMKSLPVPVEKTGRILVLEDAVRALGAAFRSNSTTTD